MLHMNKCVQVVVKLEIPIISRLILVTGQRKLQKCIKISAVNSIGGWRMVHRRDYLRLLCITVPLKPRFVYYLLNENYFWPWPNVVSHLNMQLNVRIDESTNAILQLNKFYFYFYVGQAPAKQMTQKYNSIVF